LHENPTDRFSSQYQTSNNEPQDPHRIIDNIRANIVTMNKKSSDSRQVAVSNMPSFNKMNNGQLQSQIDSHRHTQTNF
jgi:hypothetical protein